MSLFELPGIRNIKAGLTYFEFKEEYTKLLLEKKLAIGIGTYHQRYGDYCNYHRDNPQPKTTLNIIRGVPGSGKTTLAKLYAEKLKAAHLETDMEFYVDGEYKFDHTKLHSYHKRCLKKTKELLLSGKSVVVSNTFTTWKELAPYIEFAVDNDIEIDITTMTNEYGSIHGVPEETMVRMRERFETETSIWEKVNAYRQ